jgi:hypothetical protein
MKTITVTPTSQIATGCERPSLRKEVIGRAAHHLD